MVVEDLVASQEVGSQIAARLARLESDDSTPSSCCQYLAFLLTNGDRDRLGNDLVIDPVHVLVDDEKADLLENLVLDRHVQNLCCFQESHWESVELVR